MFKAKKALWILVWITEDLADPWSEGGGGATGRGVQIAPNHVMKNLDDNLLYPAWLGSNTVGRFFVCVACVVYILQVLEGIYGTYTYMLL